MALWGAMVLLLFQVQFVVDWKGMYLQLVAVANGIR